MFTVIMMLPMVVLVVLVTQAEQHFVFALLHLLHLCDTAHAPIALLSHTVEAVYPSLLRFGCSITVLVL